MRFLRILVLLILLFGGWFVVSLASFRYLEAREIVSVSNPLPDIFPVLLTSDSGAATRSCRIVYYHQLEDLRSSARAASFLIPAGFESACLEQVREFTRARDSNFDSDDPRHWSAGFRMSPLSNGRQAFEVSATWDDDHVNRSWYEASEQELFAERHLYLVGPGIALEGLRLGTGFTAAVIVPLFVFRLVRRIRARRAAP